MAQRALRGGAAAGGAGDDASAPAAAGISRFINFLRLVGIFSSRSMDFILLSSISAGGFLFASLSIEPGDV